MTRLAAAILVVFVPAALPGAGQQATARDGSCDQPPDFYNRKFTIRDVKVKHPFHFLRFIESRLADLPAGGLPAKGEMLDLEKVAAGRNAIEERQFLPSPVSAPVRIDLIVSALENCRNGQLDVVYSVYSTQILPSFGSAFESRAVERSEPQKAAGLDTEAPLRVAPALHYDRSNRFQGGGRLDWRVRQPWLRAASAEGRGSSSSRFLAAALAGDSVSAGPIARTEWQLDYLNAVDPTGSESLSHGRLAARFAAVTRPLGGTPLILRFGTSLEGGNQQSGFSGADVAPNTLANSGFGSLKLYAGLSARTRRQAFAASYGLDLGTLGASADIQYRRHIGDLAYSAWLPVGDHREFEFESRFTAGGIQIPGKIPLPQRFFGGNVQQDFIPGDSWKIRANPVLRSIPANRFNRVQDGVGAESFFALNFSAAFPVWRMPLVPSEVTSEQDFKDALDIQLSAVPGLLSADYATRDGNFTKAAEGLPALMDRLQAVESAVNEAVVPGELAELLKMCKGRLAAARIALRDFKTKKSSELFSLVNAMVDPDLEMAKAGKACLEDLNGPLQNAVIGERGKKLREQVEVIKKPFDAIDLDRYERRADDETKPIRRVIEAVLYDLNIYSISPVVVYDMARIADFRPDTAGGLRHGIGGGIRLTLVNSVSFTLGYAFNPDRRPFEGRGALFFGLTFRDLFQ